MNVLPDHHIIVSTTRILKLHCKPERKLIQQRMIHTMQNISYLT